MATGVMLMTPLLSLKGVEKIYTTESQEEITALDNINLEIKTGEFIAIVGPSGCGKTTLLKLLSGVLAPSKGEIYFAGDPLRTSHRKLLGMVFQQPALLPWRNVLSNILLPCELRGQDMRVASTEALELLKLVGLEGFAYRKAQELSYGMQQRVSICRALISNPSLLLMDEPFASLDTFTRFELTRLLLEIWGLKKQTVLFVTHSIQEAVYLADRIVVMTPRPGKIAAIVDVPLPRPRNEEHMYSEAFSKCAKTIHQFFTML
jgi:NitT/TauT family transport system ATP-binding protein